ncbi:hypothetical protein M430DRAFT_16913 [Amorphotheca resinae ATCC 22711]|uniref:Borealin N-terminal domain-containing protein n=1 Tax=Amorphotheca resinae ATCC 22711 TaxID=857342 RepID=A0A2T3B7X2_AMORE|nr:hypothetical protein M430DRAFT_16913 [Amorphotheca resinae ATCC 22711]PSS22969.1 hypothetical protein M430DRAFT_16913 [Amorphotheca resinae ATCC 22711]
MAPTRARKRKSTESSSADIPSFQTRSELVPTKTASPAITPTNRSPIRKRKMGITSRQKQALIDNLQLEITERARKLRAQYMLQAQGLRTRIEIRVNRIPVALRRANMGELLLKYSENASKSGPTAPKITANIRSPSNIVVQKERYSSRASPSPRGGKRVSDEIMIDKENEDIGNLKKLVRGAPGPPSRTVPRAILPPSRILSPRSANSRTFPASLNRPTTSPGKSNLARPVSPLKPSAPAPTGEAAGVLTSMVEKARATRGTTATRKVAETQTTGGAGRGKRTTVPAPPPRVGRGRAISDSSDASNSTVVRKSAPAVKKTAPAKKTVMGTIKGIGGATKKAPAPKASAPAVGRVLRKRN